MRTLKYDELDSKSGIKKNISGEAILDLTIQHTGLNQSPTKI